MFQIALFEPEIPPNTGNIIRLCANSGSTLHLIHPLGFSLDHSKLKRAGLDYHELAEVRHHRSFAELLRAVDRQRLFACTTRASGRYTEVDYRPGDTLLFGPESRGLPQTLLDALPRSQWIRVPMRPGNRSLNLANAVSVVMFEAWRQHGFAGAAG